MPWWPPHAPQDTYPSDHGWSRKVHGPKLVVQVACVSNQCKPLSKKLGNEKEQVNMLKTQGKWGEVDPRPTMFLLHQPPVVRRPKVHV